MGPKKPNEQFLESCNSIILMRSSLKCSLKYLNSISCPCPPHHYSGKGSNVIAFVQTEVEEVCKQLDPNMLQLFGSFSRISQLFISVDTSNHLSLAKLVSPERFFSFCPKQEVRGRLAPLSPSPSLFHRATPTAVSWSPSSSIDHCGDRSKSSIVSLSDSFSVTKGLACH